MTAPLFYCPDLVTGASPLTLSPEETRHVAAQRLRVGDPISLFDGRGHGARARVATIDTRGREVRVEITERFETPAPAYRLSLYCALPKGERLATLLDMATQLGVTHFTPLLCEHSVVQPSGNWHARAERICIEACKQSLRLQLPVLDAPQDFATALATARAATPCLWFAHPGATATPRSDDIPTAGLAIFVGPEGGFTEVEATAADRAGAIRVDLGPRLLRIETAAVALISIAGARLNAAHLNT